MSLGAKYVKDLTYIEMLVVIILGWILVALWQRCIDNFTFNSLKLNKDSTYHTFIIALVSTIIFISFVFSFEDVVGNFAESQAAGGFSPPAPPSPPIPTTTTTTNNTELLQVHETIPSAS